MSDMRLSCRLCPEETTSELQRQAKAYRTFLIWLLIGELHDHRLRSITFGVSPNTGDVEHNRIAGFQAAHNALKLRQRVYGNSIDTIDDIAFNKSGIICRRHPNFGDEAVRINLFHKQPFDVGQMFFGDQLRRKLSECDSQM